MSSLAWVANFFFVNRWDFLVPRVSTRISVAAELLSSTSSDRTVRPAPGEALSILHVTQSYFPFLDRGGPAVKVQALAHGLARRGHNVTVLTADHGLDKFPKYAAQAERSEREWRWKHDSVEAIYLPGRGIYRSATWNSRVVAFCRDRLPHFDVVHIYGTYDLLGPVVARGCRKRGIPYVIEPMGMFRPIVRNIPLKWAYRRLLGNAMIRGARRVIATSDQEKNELVEDGIPAEQIVVRRNGIDVPENLPPRGAFRKSWNLSAEMFVVLFLGRIVSKKSPELLLEAFATWLSRCGPYQEAALVFAGPAEETSYVQKLKSRAANLNSTVIFTGPLYGDDKWSAFVDADVFVLPSQNENFGNTAAEAIACRTPVIVTDQCGVAPLVDRRAGIVIPHDRGCLVTALKEMSDTQFRNQFRKGCSEVTRELSWDRPLDETDNLYRSLAKRRDRSCVPMGASLPESDG